MLRSLRSLDRRDAATLHMTYFTAKDSMMPIRKFALTVSLAVLVAAFAPALAFGQNGCINSPENPTAILVLVGAAGAAVPSLRGRLSRYLRSRR
jgi:XrtJ-associated TM-motif-TM protein